MKDCTYYDMLGVPMDATDEQLNNARNFLVKKFHPDSNIDSGFDTTLYMQNVLDAYQILSDPRKRRSYDRRILNPHRRDRETRRRTAYETESRPLSPDFAPFWEASSKLNELVNAGSALLKQKRFGRHKEVPEELLPTLTQLCADAMEHIRVLEDGEIPRQYWFSYPMNWLLFQWSQHRSYSYGMLFSLYDSYLEQNKSAIEKRKISHQCSAFLENLDKLMEYGQA